MDLVDVEELIGERIFVELDEFEYAIIGTLEEINERWITLLDWYRVDEWDQTHILKFSHPPSNISSLEYDEIQLGTVGSLREVTRIERNLKKGDPHDD